MIWDYTPVTFEIYVHNLAGRNLLEPSTEGNILEKDIYIKYKGEIINASYGWPENQLYKNPDTRAIMPFWYGIFIAPAFNSYGPDLGNHLCIGEFDGTANEEFELIIHGNSYDFKFTNEINKDGSLKRDYYLNGHKISTSKLYLRYDEDFKDTNYPPKK